MMTKTMYFQVEDQLHQPKNALGTEASTGHEGIEVNVILPVTELYSFYMLRTTTYLSNFSCL